MSNGNNITRQQKICESPQIDCSSTSTISFIEDNADIDGKSDMFETNDLNKNQIENEENKILTQISSFMADQFESVPLDTLPTGGPIEIVIVSALDPDNIFFRFKKWVK